jgi:hypothetical protein
MKRVGDVVADHYPFILLGIFLTILMAGLVWLGLVWLGVWGENPFNMILISISIVVLFITIFAGSIYYAIRWISRSISKARIDRWKDEVGLEADHSKMGSFLLENSKSLWVAALISVGGVCIILPLILFFIVVSTEPVFEIGTFAIIFFVAVMTWLMVLGYSLANAYEYYSEDWEPRIERNPKGKIFYYCRKCGAPELISSRDRPWHVECTYCGSIGLVPDLRSDPRSSRDHHYLLCPRCNSGLIYPKPAPSKGNCPCGVEIVIDDIKFQKETKPRDLDSLLGR